MSVGKVEAALQKAYRDAEFFAVGKTAFENELFTKPTAEAWCAVFFLQNLPSVSTLGSDGYDEVDGIFQVDLNFPLNKGTKESKDKADQFPNVFTPGDRLYFDNQEVLITSCGRSSGRPVDGWWKVVVTIQWYAQILR